MWNIETENKVGFIDWNGVFHSCKYGDHAVLSLYLIKQARKELKMKNLKDVSDDSGYSEIREVTDLLKVIRLEESNLGACYCTIPMSMTDKGLKGIKKYLEEEKPTDTMKKAITLALEDYRNTYESGVIDGNAIGSCGQYISDIGLEDHLDEFENVIPSHPAHSIEGWRESEEEISKVEKIVPSEEEGFRKEEEEIVFPKIETHTPKNEYDYNMGKYDAAKELLHWIGAETTLNPMHPSDTGAPSLFLLKLIQQISNLTDDSFMKKIDED